ncbi:unnamed protein product, partial [Laminaria digitata]
FLEASSLAGAEGVARDGAMPPDDGEVLAQKPVVGGLLHGEAVTPSSEGGGSSSRLGASSSDERPNEGELEKGRERRVAATASERDCRPHSSDDDNDVGGRGGSSGGGGVADDCGDMSEDDKEGEEQEEEE